MTKDAVPPAWAGLAGRDDETTAPAAVPSAAPSSLSHSAATLDTLKQAMRRARADNAERAGVLSDLRAARLGRLDLLLEALKPLVAQIPAEVDTFDVGLLPGGNPRLFIDMIGFVEMGRDTRLYRLLQDTRTGRVVLKESEDVETMVDAVTDYVARRLLEREKALAADTPPLGPGRRRAEPLTPPRPDSQGRAEPDDTEDPRFARRPSGPGRLLVVAFSFLIDLLGSAALFTALAVGAWYVWTKLHVAP